MKIHPHTAGPAATNAYLLVDDTTRTAALIDIPYNAANHFLTIIKQENLTLTHLLLTHGHWDHLADHALITAAHPNAKLLIHPLDEPKLQHPGSSAFKLPFTIPPRNADDYLTDNQHITIGSLTLHILHTPGHSPGLCILHLPTHHILFCNDLVFQNSIGRTDFPDCSPPRHDPLPQTPPHPPQPNHPPPRPRPHHHPRPRTHPQPLPPKPHLTRPPTWCRRPRRPSFTKECHHNRVARPLKNVSLTIRIPPHLLP